jgi:hypothetical protein
MALDPLAPSDDNGKAVEAPSSMIADDEHVLIPGVVEKAKAALDRSQAVERPCVPSVALENRPMEVTRFHSEHAAVAKANIF